MFKQLLSSGRRIIEDNGTAFGYSLIASGTFTVLNTLKGSPSFLEVMLAVFCATATFSLIQVVNQLGLTSERPERDERVVQFGNALNIFSVTGAVGAVLFIGLNAPDTLAWAVAPAIATIVYLTLTSVEFVIAERLLRYWDGK